MKSRPQPSQVIWHNLRRQKCRGRVASLPCPLCSLPEPCAASSGPTLLYPLPGNPGLNSSCKQRGNAQPLLPHHHWCCHWQYILIHTEKPAACQHWPTQLLRADTANTTAHPTSHTHHIIHPAHPSTAAAKLHIHKRRWPQTQATQTHGSSNQQPVAFARSRPC
jgi:hypothetical protein